MTEADATAPMEKAHAAPPAGDVEMTSADAPAQLEHSVAPESAATSPTEKSGQEEKEPPAAPAPAENSEQAADAAVSSTVAAPTSATETAANGSAPDGAESAVGASADVSADVKMEDVSAEEAASSTKHNDQETTPSTTAAPVAPQTPQTDEAAVAEPAAKRLKVASKPSDAAVAADAPAPAAGASLAAAAISAPLMMSRDDMAKLEEDTGLLKFDVITNDGTPEHMVQLTTLKNIFARQLPKMPREYIVRLVFDRNHRSMVILKNSKTVIGGICYRPFEPNHFAEIAFCAINAADQVKGYGTRLMNHLKEYVKASGITHFLTYADNYAIGYFKKQGFAKVVSMPRANWFGYIKDYDGGTLMECTIHHQINYLRITSMVHAQRKKIQDKIKERSHADIVYPGLTRFAEGRTMDLYMIPGVQEAGWTRAVIRNSRVGTRDPGSLKTQLQQLWKHVSSHRSAWPFHEPVDTTIVVDYLDYIKEPVDLTLIQKRIESGHYLSKSAFKDDLDKMCNNCMVYNTPDTNYYKAAKDLQEFIEKRVQVAK